MRGVKAKIMLVATVMLILSISLVGCGEPKGAYKGNIYVAGHGGHIADATIVIDPTDTKKPFKIPKYAIWTGGISCTLSFSEGQRPMVSMM